MPRNQLLLIPLFTLLIISCSPHPASGQWNNINIGDNEITMINVMFDGKAQFYATDKQQVVRRCFWAGVDKKTINLTCVHPDDTDTDIKYQLQISDGQALLQQSDQAIASFRKN